MSNQKDRETKELKNLLDPRYARQFWRTVGNAIAQRPAAQPTNLHDKDGNLTKESQVERTAYDRLANDLKILKENRAEPTELEMIMASQMIIARTNPVAATFVRDTLGAKPVDESKIDQTVNEYSGLTDEELELIATARANKQPEDRPTASGPMPIIMPAKDREAVYFEPTVARTWHVRCINCQHETYVVTAEDGDMSYLECTSCNARGSYREMEE